MDENPRGVVIVSLASYSILEWGRFNPLESVTEKTCNCDGYLARAAVNKEYQEENLNGAA